MSRRSQREALARLAGGTILVSGDAFGRSKATDLEVRLADRSEYMFEPGLNDLNTAALGPTPRTILDRVLIFSR